VFNTFNQNTAAKAYNMTTTASLESFADKNILASLEAYFEDGTASSIPTSHADMATLWEACWDAWWACDPAEHLALGSFMAAVKAAYPSLPGKPSWAEVFDPEEI